MVNQLRIWIVVCQGTSSILGYSIRRLGSLIESPSGVRVQVPLVFRFCWRSLFKYFLHLVCSIWWLVHLIAAPHLVCVDSDTLCLIRILDFPSHSAWCQNLLHAPLWSILPTDLSATCTPSAIFSPHLCTSWSRKFTPQPWPPSKFQINLS